MTDIVPVVLASDNNYASYMSVLIISILKNAKTKSDYDFYILVPDSFKEEFKQKIEKDCDFYRNKKINFINMGDAFSNAKKMIAHITNQTYYRLKSAEILPEKYDKCIYLDNDTIVVGDLAELYNIDLEDNYVAGTYAPSWHFYKNSYYHCQRLGILSTEQYINAGVLLLNLKKIRENNMTEILYQEALKNYPTQDQDVINKIFYNSIKHIGLKYNFMTKFQSLSNNKIPEYKELCNLFGKEEIEEAIKNPLVIHYADKIKPWNKKINKFSNYWWKYAKLSVFYKKIICDYFIILPIKHIIYILKQIFSIKNEGIRKVITIFGIKIKIKRIQNLKKEYTFLQDIEHQILEKNYYNNLFSVRNEIIKVNNKDYFNNFVAFKYDLYTMNEYGVNLGDYIQTIATLNLIKKLYPDNNIIYFDRDSLGNYDKTNAYTVMQGWFSESHMFLPNKKIKPIFMGTHITDTAQKNIYEFLKYNPSYFENETIGCRDKYTQTYFSELKIPNYLSRCLTLTLPKREETNKQCKIFVVNLSKEILSNLPPRIVNNKNTKIINQIMIDPNYHEMHYYNSCDIYINKAKELINKYRNEAKLVITSALHCASPCIAMGIPVILFKNDGNANRLSVLDGIIKQYTYEDLVYNKIDFEVKAPDIEDLKEAMIRNLDLTVKLKQGINIDTKELDDIRKFISTYSIL